jgi:non-heme chloroperoxidase
VGYLEVEGTRRIYFEHYEGSGRPVVLIHGWGVTASCWDNVVPALVANGNEVVTFDHRTCGRSDKDFDDVSIEAIGSDVAELCAHLSLDRPVLNGWSLGGAVAVDAASRLGSQISGLVLTGGASPRYTAAPDWPHGGGVADVEGVLAGVESDRATTFKAVSSAVCAVPVSPEVVDWMWAMFMAMGPRGGDTLRSLADVDQRKILATIEVPVLLLHGRQDAFVPFSGAEAAVGLWPDARLVEFEQSGHAPFVEERDKYLSELVGFLNR